MKRIRTAADRLAEGMLSLLRDFNGEVVSVDLTYGKRGVPGIRQVRVNTDAGRGKAVARGSSGIRRRRWIRRPFVSSMTGPS